MSTVGYGDIIPQTNLGRLFAIGWMYYALILYATITGLVSTFVFDDSLFDISGQDIAVLHNSYEAWFANKTFNTRNSEYENYDKVLHAIVNNPNIFAGLLPSKVAAWRQRVLKRLGLSVVSTYPAVVTTFLLEQDIDDEQDYDTEQDYDMGIVESVFVMDENETEPLSNDNFTDTNSQENKNILKPSFETNGFTTNLTSINPNSSSTNKYTTSSTTEGEMLIDSLNSISVNLNSSSTKLNSNSANDKKSKTLSTTEDQTFSSPSLLTRQCFRQYKYDLVFQKNVKGRYHRLLHISLLQIQNLSDLILISSGRFNHFHTSICVLVALMLAAFVYNKWRNHRNGGVLRL